MAKTSLIYGASIVLHGALAISVASLEKPVHREVVAISMSESKKAKPEPPKPVDPPKAPPANAEAAAPRREARAKAAPAEAKPAAPPVSAPAADHAGLDALPDFGLTMGNGPGLALPGGGSAGPATTAKANDSVARPARTLAPTAQQEASCTDPLVKPKPSSISQPAYTAAAREAAVEGRVRVEVTVDENGKVVSTRLLAGLGYGLDEAALEAAKRATFSAGTRCGKPVRATFVMAMRFSL